MRLPIKFMLSNLVYTILLLAIVLLHAFILSTLNSNCCAGADETLKSETFKVKIYRSTMSMNLREYCTHYNKSFCTCAIICLGVSRFE